MPHTLSATPELATDRFPLKIHAMPGGDRCARLTAQGYVGLVRVETRMFESELKAINTIDAVCTARVLVRARIAAVNHTDPGAVY